MANRRDEFLPAPEYGRSLQGVGLNLLVADVAREVDFLTTVFALKPRFANKDFAVMTHAGQDWMLHGDHTYHSHPLLGFLSDGVARGLGIEIRLYDLDPDTAERRAVEAGHDVLAGAAHKPHGLYEAYIVSPAGYLYVPSIHSFEKG
ncbi:VOC family protein [Limibacillus halophilus]|uniref:Putative enzyme related to lactoylglutathione lyase n=1 Tax=Limibacillus halophilus TaxID=1579333 RepID=A0A839SVB0_9PROT|nr:glyoxalase [Limibacillus halophilus]MBB3066402.1 putative enzyme related to lactoylglutathione lyase [Limibacillus halophilus]